MQKKSKKTYAVFPVKVPVKERGAKNMYFSTFNISSLVLVSVFPAKVSQMFGNVWLSSFTDTLAKTIRARRKLYQKSEIHNVMVLLLSEPARSFQWEGLLKTRMLELVRFSKENFYQISSMKNWYNECWNATVVYSSSI